MTISNELLRDGLIEAGVPDRLVTASEQEIPDASIKAKYLLASDLLQTRPVLFVLGQDSPIKEHVCVKLMRRYMFRNDKTGRWLTPARVLIYGGSILPAGIVAVIGVDLLNENQIKLLSQLMREWIPSGRAFILSTSTKIVFDEMFGIDLASYLSHHASILEINAERGQIVTV
jgi:hypothetical protein